MLLFDHQLSCTTMDYHQLLFTLNMFKIFMIVDDDNGEMSLQTIIDYHAPFDRDLTAWCGTYMYLVIINFWGLISHLMGCSTTNMSKSNQSVLFHAIRMILICFYTQFFRMKMTMTHMANHFTTPNHSCCVNQTPGTSRVSSNIPISTVLFLSTKIFAPHSHCIFAH